MKVAIIFSNNLAGRRTPVEYFINANNLSVSEPLLDDLGIIRESINVQPESSETAAAQVPSKQIGGGAVKVTLPCDLIPVLPGKLISTKTIPVSEKMQVAFFGRVLIPKEKNSNGKKEPQELSSLVCVERVSPESDDFKVTFSCTDGFNDTAFDQGPLKLLSVIAEGAASEPLKPPPLPPHLQRQVDLILASILATREIEPYQPEPVRFTKADNEEIDRLLGKSVQYLFYRGSHSSSPIKKAVQVLIGGLVGKDKTERIDLDHKQLQLLTRINFENYDCLGQLINLAKTSLNKDWKPAKYFLQNPTVFFADASLTTNGPIEEELKWHPISKREDAERLINSHNEHSQTKIPYNTPIVKELLEILTDNLRNKNGARETIWDISSLELLTYVNFTNYPNVNELVELANADENRTSLPAVYFLQNSTIPVSSSEPADGKLFSDDEKKEIQKLLRKTGIVKLESSPVIKKLVELFIDGLKDENKTVLKGWEHAQLRLLLQTDFSSCGGSLDRLIALAKSNQNRYLLPVKYFMANQTVYQKYLLEL